MWDNLLQRFQNVSVKLGINSALRPYLAFCSLISPVTLVAALTTSDRTLALVLLAIAAFPVLTTSIAGVRLAFKHPDTLRSEEWQLREQVVQLMIQKGKPFIIDPSTLESMANPEGPRMLQPAETELLKEGETK
jgi:hypothetical protein